MGRVILVLDALNRSGRYWLDDAQVSTISAQKCYGACPATHVEIETVAEPRTKAEWRAPTSKPRSS